MSVSTLHPLPKIAVGRHLSSESVNLDNYQSWAGEALTEEIRQLSKDLHGLRVCNVNATAAGGGVAELLSRIIPVHLALEIQAEWRLIYGDKDFFTITKSFHNALQGGILHLTEATEQAYLERNRQSAEMLPDDYDVFIVHDPQPVAIRHFKNSSTRKWIWRCHIDSSNPNSEVWEFLRTYVQEYDAAVFTMKAFQPGDLDLRRIVFIPPAIDPAATKKYGPAYRRLSPCDWRNGSGLTPAAAIASGAFRSLEGPARRHRSLSSCEEDAARSSARDAWRNGRRRSRGLGNSGP